MDFKVISSLSAGSFGEWEKAEFSPEKDFLTKAGKISGISAVETQTFTLMPVESGPASKKAKLSEEVVPILGTMTFGWNKASSKVDDTIGGKFLDAFIDAGCDEVDTAYAYAGTCLLQGARAKSALLVNLTLPLKRAQEAKQKKCWVGCLLLTVELVPRNFLSQPKQILGLMATEEEATYAKRR